MFWTVDDQSGPVTLCDRCALFAVNAAAMDSESFSPFGSMEEAMVVINGMSAAIGLDPLEVTASEVGRCGHCRRSNLTPATA